MAKQDGWHYLATSSGGLPPKRFLTLGLATCPVATGPTKTGATRQECVAWSLGLYAGGIVESSWQNDWAGKGNERLSRIIKKCLRKGEQLDLWISGASVALSALGFWEAIERRKWLLSTPDWHGVCVISNPPIVITVRPADGIGTLRILCLSNLGVETVDELREATGGNYLVSNDWPSNGWNATATADAIQKATYEYLESWFAFVVKEGLGRPSITVAGQARTAYRRRFVKFPLLCHRNPVASRMEEQAIFQGRTECFQVGRIKGPIYHLDYQSFYPSVVKLEPMPARLKAVLHGREAWEMATSPSDWCQLADVTIETGENSYPYHNEDAQIFPIGKFRTTICGRELDYALTNGDVVEIHSVALYEPELMFADYTDWCLEQRRIAKRRGDKVAEGIIKLLTNSLWGSFAKRRRLWEATERQPCEKPWSDWYEKDSGSGEMKHYRSIGYLCQEERDYGFDRNALPAVTAFVASAGRDEMRRLIRLCKPGRVYYVSTDSILCDDLAYAELLQVHLIVPGEPGRLKIVDTYEWVDIHGIHAVETPNGGTFAGVPDKASGNTLLGHSWESVEGITGALLRKQRPDSWMIPKHRKTTSVYRHGVVYHDGHIEPIRIVPRQVGRLDDSDSP